MSENDMHRVAASYATKKFAAQVDAMHCMDRRDLEVACEVAMRSYDEVMACLEMGTAKEEL